MRHRRHAPCGAGHRLEGAHALCSQEGYWKLLSADFDQVRTVTCISPRTRCLILEADGGFGATDELALIRSGVWAECVRTPSEALQRLVATAWGVVVLNLDLSDGEGVMLAQHAARLAPRPAILVTSARISRLALQALHKLEIPIVPKSLLSRGLAGWIAAMVAAVETGNAPKQGPSIQSARPGQRDGSDAPPDSETISERCGDDRRRKLSERESVVFGLLTIGRAPKDIADELGVSHSTVRTHAARAYGKLGATNLREAIATLKNS